MHGKRNILACLILAGIVMLSGAVFFIIKSGSATIKNGTLDLSVWNGTHAVALVVEAQSENEHIHVTGANPGETLSLRIPPNLAVRRLYIDGKPVPARGTNEAAADGSVWRYQIQTYEIVPSHDSFDIDIQLSQSAAYQNRSIIYLGTARQIERINAALNGYDIFIIAFLFIVICYNIFYFFLRKDLFFLVFILMCLMMAGKTLINGSFLLGSLFPNVTFRTATYIELFTKFFLPACWLAITYFSNVVTLPKSVVRVSFIYAFAFLLASFAVSASVLSWLYLLAELVWLAAAGYIISKSLEASIVKHLSWQATGLLLSGVAILTFCSALNLFQYIFNGRGALDFLPIGLIFYTMLWDYSYTYQYDVLLKDRLKVLEDLNAANEKSRSLELKFLRSQIRPHFINNVLNSIIAVSLTDSESSRELLCHFSTYLKSCYDFGEPYNSVKIENEISVVKAYIALEKARYSDSLQVEYKIDNLSFSVPPLILQPLVENAIKHNKISAEKPLSVLIYITDNGDTVRIGVTDNGRGFDLETVPALLRGELSGQGVGIYNVNMRLEKIYGTTLKIENREGGGCDVYMILPHKKIV